jgi:hypothetical protein
MQSSSTGKSVPQYRDPAPMAGSGPRQVEQSLAIIRDLETIGNVRILTDALIVDTGRQAKFF